MIECFTWLDFRTHWIFSHFRIQSDFFILLQMPSEINDFINELRSTYANVRLIPQNRPNSESDANKLNGTLIRRKGDNLPTSTLHHIRFHLWDYMGQKIMKRTTKSVLRHAIMSIGAWRYNYKFSWEATHWKYSRTL